MLSIITDLFGPIFAKEMVEMSRRWRYYQNRIIFGVVVLIVLLMVHQESQYRYMNRGGVTLQTLSKMAEVFFLSYLWVQYLLVYLFVPFFLTGVIAGEREHKTLELLFTTQLGNREIIFGKLGSRVVSMMMLILSGVPIVAITMLFGGVNPQVFLYALLSTMLAVLYTSSMAIYFSTTTKTTMGALVRTYWWMICWILIVPMIAGMTIELLVHSGLISQNNMTTVMWLQEGAVMVLTLLNPVAPFVVSVIDFFGVQLRSALGTWYFFYLLIAPMLWSFLLIFLAIRNVRREPGPRRGTIALRKIINWLVGLITLRPITSRLLAKLPKSKDDRWLWFPVVNPLWQRARRAWVYDREQHLQRAQVGGWLLVILSMVLAISLDKGFLTYREGAMFFMSWIWLGVAVAACMVSGTSIINDRRRGFFEFVLVTPLFHWEVIQGTFQSCWRHIKKIYLLVLATMIFFVVTGSVNPGMGLLSVLIGTLNLMLIILNGIICSLVARSMAGALIATFAFPAITLIGPPMMSTLFRVDAAGAMIVLCLIFLPISWILTVWRKNVFTVCFFFLMMHFGILTLFTWWLTHDRNDHDLPLMAIHPGIQTFEPLMDSRYSTSSRFAHVWSTVVVLYGAGLLVNMVWLCWWTCRHYEVLSGRKQVERSRKKAKLAIAPA